MPTIVKAKYSASGKSSALNSTGMRPMQEKAFAKAASQYLLIKAPPASGKSRALMYIALEKLLNKQVKKVIVAVPERSIGASFATTRLTRDGFHSDWIVDVKNDLCAPGGESNKVKALVRFLSDESAILICTHATLRFAFENIEISKFNNVLLAVDEFHHVSASESSKLGNLIRELLVANKSHILAMTGSYFRGDSLPILLPEDELLFDKITYNYFEQLDGYRYLKSLSIDIAFYQGKYLNNISEVLVPGKKTIIHIPNVNSGESTKEKYLEVDAILDQIGELHHIEDDSGVLVLTSHRGEYVRVADLVNDDPAARAKIITYLRGVKEPWQVDIVVALGMAKEGFDWPFCEQALTVGYRASLTEIIQIIGRATRDSPGKESASFVNYVAEPVASRDEVSQGTNNIFKAIAASLLMEDILAPRFGFLPSPQEKSVATKEGHLAIRGYRTPSSQRVVDILENEISEVKARVFQDSRIQEAALGALPAKVIHEVLIPKVIREIYPGLSSREVNDVSSYVSISSVLRPSNASEINGERFFQISNSILSVDQLDLDLIFAVNPFLDAFRVVSKGLDADVLRVVQDAIRASRTKLTFELADELWPEVNEFVTKFEREPSFDSLDEYERTLSEVLALMRTRAAKE